MKKVIVVLTLLKSHKYLCNIKKQICLVVLTFQTMSIENIFSLWACAYIYSVFIFTFISSSRPSTLLWPFTRLMKATIPLKRSEIKMLPKFNLIWKIFSKVLTFDTLHELTHFCNILILFQYICRCIYKSIVFCYHRFCTHLHFSSLCIVCFLYKIHAEKVHLKQKIGNSMINIVNTAKCSRITMI